MKAHCFHDNAGLSRRRSTVGLPWELCCRCGLLVLGNNVSIRARRAPCPGQED